MFYLKPLIFTISLFLSLRNISNWIVNKIIKPNFWFPTWKQVSPLSFHLRKPSLTIQQFKPSALEAAWFLPFSHHYCSPQYKPSVSPVVFISRLCLNLAVSVHFHSSYPRPSHPCLSPEPCSSPRVSFLASNAVLSLAVYLFAPSWSFEIINWVMAPTCLQWLPMLLW